MAISLTLKIGAAGGQRAGGIMVSMFFLGKIYFCVLCCGVCVGKDEMLLFFCGDVVTHRW